MKPNKLCKDESQKSISILMQIYEFTQTQNNILRTIFTISNDLLNSSGIHLFVLPTGELLISSSSFSNREILETLRKSLELAKAQMPHPTFQGFENPHLRIYFYGLPLRISYSSVYLMLYIHSPAKGTDFRFKMGQLGNKLRSLYERAIRVHKYRNSHQLII